MKQTITTIEKDVFDNANEQYLHMIEALASEDYQKMEHGEIEKFLEKEGYELLRNLLQAHLDLRMKKEKLEKEVVGKEGEKRPHCRKKQERKIETLFGEVKVRRRGYSSKKEGVTILYPEDGRLNLAVDKYSDGLRRRVAIEASLVSFDETKIMIEETTAAKIGKRQCEELIVKVAQDFKEFYEERCEELFGESNEDLLVLTSDGKGIVMHEKDLREATAKAAKKSSKQKKTRLSPGEKRQRKRMATVASVYSTPRYYRKAQEIMGKKREDSKRPKIMNKRVWASVERDAKSVIESVFEEASRRDSQHEREWVVVIDGEPHQLKTIKKMAKNYNVENITIILDFIHVLEYLWKAALCFFKSGTQEAETWVEQRAIKILQGKASDVAAGIRRSATLKKLTPKTRENVDKCADYLLKYREYLHYEQYLSLGYPIASGVIEGACRHLICDRMDITGARWRLKRAEAVLQIRSLRASGHFDEYWQFHKMQELKRNHLNKFQAPEKYLAA